MVTQRWKNVENETKVEAIKRLLSNNKRLRASYVLITKSCGKNISKQVIFNLENTISLIIFYLHIFEYKLYQINTYFRKTKHVEGSDGG
jgi:hypothetical protein